MNEYALLITVILALVMLSASLYFDLRYQRIPNKLCLIALVTGLILNTFFYTWQGLSQSLLGAGLALIILLPAYKFRLLGAGDVKIMIAIGTISGPLIIGWSIAYAIIFGAITSILLALKAVGLRGMKLTASRYLHSFYLRQYFKPESGDMGAVKVPYAPALTLGWILATYNHQDIYELMWKAELLLNDISTSLNLI